MNQLWPKRTSKLSCATQSAGMPCFVQQSGVSVFGEVLKVVGSCFRSGLMFGMCSISLLRLVIAAMRVVVQYASFFFLKQKMTS